jgi:hypothetical protein
MVESGTGLSTGKRCWHLKFRQSDTENLSKC